MKKVGSVILKILCGILKVLGILFSLICLLVFVFVLGKNTAITTQIGSIAFEMAGGLLIMLMIVIAVLSVLTLVLKLVKKKKAGVLLIILTVLSVAAVGFGGVEFAIEKNVVQSNGGTASLSGDKSLSNDAQPDEQVVYASKDGQDLTISVYRTSEEYQGQDQPVYIHIHGGGWQNDNADTSAWLHRYAADNGYVAFSINYRLATEDDPTWEKATEDVADAIAWIKDHASEYGGDPDRILLTGESAGGQLALLYTGLVTTGAIDGPVPSALCVMYPAIDLNWIAENASFISPVFTDGMIEHYIGGSAEEYSDRIEAVSPMNYINENFPPVYIIHGEKDSLVDCSGSETFADALNAAGGNAELVLIPFANHIFVNHQEVATLMLHYAEQQGLTPAR